MAILRTSRARRATTVALLAGALAVSACSGSANAFKQLSQNAARVDEAQLARIAESNGIRTSTADDLARNFETPVRDLTEAPTRGLSAEQRTQAIRRGCQLKDVYAFNNAKTYREQELIARSYTSGGQGYIASVIGVAEAMQRAKATGDGYAGLTVDLACIAASGG